MEYHADPEDIDSLKKIVYARAHRVRNENENRFNSHLNVNTILTESRNGVRIFAT